MNELQTAVQAAQQMAGNIATGMTHQMISMAAEIAMLRQERDALAAKVSELSIAKDAADRPAQPKA